MASFCTISVQFMSLSKVNIRPKDDSWRLDGEKGSLSRSDNSSSLKTRPPGPQKLFPTLNPGNSAVTEWFLIS